MCGIAGFFQNKFDYTKEDSFKNRLILMRDSILHRGPDGNGIRIDPHSGMAHTRLSPVKQMDEASPLTKSAQGKAFVLSFDGTIYNAKELRTLLQPHQLSDETSQDAELILNGYLAIGSDFFKEINGVYAFALYDPIAEELILCRDHFGIKPLFYQMTNDSFVYGSEPKALFAFGIVPKLDQDSFGEIFGLGPARTPGHGVFHNMKEVLPGHFLRISEIKKEPLATHSSICYAKQFHENQMQIEDYIYWQLESKEHTDDYEKTLAAVSHLVSDSICRQMQADAPIASLLSGGLDSSLVSAISSCELKKSNEQLATFSFEFSGNKVNFKPNAFQSSLDRPFVDIMVSHIGSHHTYLECTNEIQADALYDAVDARDVPCMADIESSLLYFCSQVAKTNCIALTGECADESAHTG